MDMKRILQAMDGVASKPVEGGNDMKKFLQVITEGANPHKVTLPVQMAMQHYQAEEKKPVVKSSGLLEKYFQEVEQEVLEGKTQKRELMNQYASVIAERVMMKEGKAVKQRLDPHCWKGKHKEGTKVKGGVRVNNCVPNESVVNEKSTTEKQARFMAAAAHDPAFAAKTGIKQSVAKEFNKADTGTKKLSNAMKHKPKKKVSEHEIPGHSMGFTGGVGPGMQVSEMPIAATDDPNDPMIHSHQKANPMTLKGRIGQARAQLKELAQLAESDNLANWEHICQLAKGGMFMGLEQNLEQIRHGISELAAKRSRGGVNSRGIDKAIGEAVLPNIKAATPKAIKPKKKTSTCKTGQVQTGMQTKDGKLVPKCSVK